MNPGRLPFSPTQGSLACGGRDCCRRRPVAVCRPGRGRVWWAPGEVPWPAGAPGGAIPATRLRRQAGPAPPLQDAREDPDLVQGPGVQHCEWVLLCVQASSRHGLSPPCGGVLQYGIWDDWSAFPGDTTTGRPNPRSSSRGSSVSRGVTLGAISLRKSLVAVRASFKERFKSEAFSGSCSGGK